MSAGRPSREVAHRLFAVEFDDATVSLTESDDEMAPSYVVTPTGALVNRAFVVGTLTAVDQVGDDIYRGRVADPTDTFVTYAGQYQPAAANFLADAEVPAVVALTGKARTFQPEGSDDVLSSLRPERFGETTPATRDHWVIETARHTLGRVELMARVRAAGVGAEAVDDALEGAPPHVATGIRRAIEHYDPSAAYLVAVHDRAVEALEVMAGERDAVRPLDHAPAEGAGDYDDLAEGGFVEAWLGTEVTVAVPTAAPAGGGASDPAAESTEPASEVPETPDDPAPAAPDEPADDPPDDEADDGELYELSDAEREAVEAEYDVGFATGDEIDEPPEETEPAAEPAADPAATEPEPDPSEEPAEPDAEAETASDDEAEGEDDDLEGAVIEHMRELDGGDGVDRETLIEAVVEATDADADAVGDAVQDALMSGTCYEPTEGRLKPI